MELQPEINTTECHFCNKEILVAKTTYAPPLYCADCYSKHQSGVNISEIRRKREDKANNKHIPPTFIRI